MSHYVFYFKFTIHSIKSDTGNYRGLCSSDESNGMIMIEIINVHSKSITCDDPLRSPN